MKLIKNILLFSFIIATSCSTDDEIQSQKPESKDIISLEYEGKRFDFKNLHHGKYTDKDRNLIGFFAEAEIVIDDQHKNRVLLLFKTDFKNNVEFAGIEFTPFKPAPTYPHNVYAYVYQYIMTQHGSPFKIDIKMENGRITGSFEGYVHRSADPFDMTHMDPVYLSAGTIDIEAKSDNN